MAHNDFTKHEQTVQELQNRGFDPTFDVPTVEILGYDSGSNALRRITVDDGGKLLVAERSDGGDTDAASVGDPDKHYTASFESVAGTQVHVVGDGDKYVVSNAIEGSAVSNVDAIPIAGTDFDGNKQNLKVDDDGCLAMIDHAHYKIHEGLHFKCGYGGTALAEDATVAMVFTTPDSSLRAHWTLVAKTTGPVTVAVYENPSLSAVGTAVTVFNRNRNSSNTTGLTVTHTPTITTNGTKLAEKWIGSEGFKATVGDEIRGTSEFILKQNEQYLVLATVTTDAGTDVSIGGDWYEET